MTALPSETLNERPAQVEPPSLINTSNSNREGAWLEQYPFVLIQPPPSPALSPYMIANVQASIEQAGRENRKGVIAFASGDTKTAFLAFRGALQQLESLGPIVFAPPANLASATQPVDLQALGQTLVNTPAPMLEAVGVPSFDDGYIHLYANVVDFLGDAQQPGPRDGGRFAYQVSFYSALVMFNLAVAMHRQGLCHNEHDALVSAIHCYDMSMRTISTIPITEYSDKLMFIMLAIWNNEAQICWSLAEYDRARDILEGVRRLAARLLLERRTSLDEIDQQHIYEFVLNVITLKEPTSAPCA